MVDNLFLLYHRLYGIIGMYYFIFMFVKFAMHTYPCEPLLPLLRVPDSTLCCCICIHDMCFRRSQNSCAAADANTVVSKLHSRWTGTWASPSFPVPIQDEYSLHFVPPLLPFVPLLLPWQLHQSKFWLELALKLSLLA